jgi:transcription elongation GreA/GreB family factor
VTQYITRTAFEKWNKRLEDIRREVREVIQEIHEAAKHGDLSENAEYQYAVEHRDRLLHEEKTILERKAQIRQFIEDLPVEDGIVDIGTIITLRTEDDEELVYALLGCLDDVSPKGGKVVPYAAPLAQQMLKREQGDVVTLNLPNRTFEVEIVAVEPVFGP